MGSHDTNYKVLQDIQLHIYIAVNLQLLLHTPTFYQNIVNLFQKTYFINFSICLTL